MRDSGHTDGEPAGRGQPRFERGWPRAKRAVVVGVARGTITVAAALVGNDGSAGGRGRGSRRALVEADVALMPAHGAGCR